MPARGFDALGEEGEWKMTGFFIGLLTGIIVGTFGMWLYMLLWGDM